jgi:hypothetical protein
VLVAQGKFAEALAFYQQSSRIRQVLAEQDKTNSEWQRNLTVSFQKVGTTTAKMSGDDSVGKAQESLRTALELAEKYSGQDRQQLIDDLNQDLQKLTH